MLNRHTPVVAFIALLVVFVTPAFSQGIAEYGTTASASATAAASTASTIQKSMNRAGEALGSATTPSQSQPKVIDVEKSRAAAPTLEAVMRANKQKLESAAGATGATLQIASVPTHSVIFINGLAVAYAPADVRVPAGKHVIQLRHPAYFDYQKQLSLAERETLRLEPKLSADPRQLFISFDK